MIFNAICVLALKARKHTSHSTRRKVKMKQRLAALLIGATLAMPVLAADSYTVDSSHTYPNFEINHLGFSNLLGQFGTTTGKITLDRAAKSGSIDITIEEFFNVAKFTTLTYKSSKLKFTGDKLTGVDGDLTMMGVTKPVSLTVTNFTCKDHPMTKKPVCGANATAALKRSEWGLAAYVPAVGDEVKIAIQIEATKD
jgi:polyisoprenoid-binding protein YceI